MNGSPSSILLDTNIWLDNYLSFRPGSPDARALIDVSRRHGIQLLYAAGSLRDVFFLAERLLKRATKNEKGMVGEADAQSIRQICWAIADNMYDLGTAVGADGSDLWLARKYRMLHGDLEDNVILAAVERSRAEFLVTTDAALLRHAPFAALPPKEMLAYITMRDDSDGDSDEE